MAKRVRAFISFAAEDERIRDLFVGQGKLTETPWEIADWSIHEPFTEKWKTQARERIRRTDVVIMLVGKNTWAAEGAIWEVNCGTGEGKKAFGVHISKDDKGRIPSCFTEKNVIEWTWNGVADMIRKATS